MWRRHLSLLAFLLIVVASTDYSVVYRLLFRYDALRSTLRQAADPSPWFPEYIRFLGEVRRKTAPGDSIALAVPALHWEYGYSYAYYRASYLLAGREVLPLITPNDRFLPDNLSAADRVAAWQSRVLADRPALWKGHGGVLLGR
ncbi:MAG TPA: hypothetical protein VFL80_06255 [Thermoanaerobaculia bacterium]|nr:hypothetical protein [Thermoanaerobaculia bacterium]